MTVPLYTGPVSGRFEVPGSKSIANRALLCAALARGTSVLSGIPDAEDTELLINGLNQLGVLVRKSGTTAEVSGTGGRLYAPKFPIPVGNAGTTFRFLLAAATLASGRTAFETSERMADRPIEELLKALLDLGATVRRTPIGTRFEVVGPSLSGGRTAIGGERSSQFLSALLMAAPFAATDVRIELTTPLVSAPYVRMTEAVMNAFGVVVDNPQTGTYSVRSHQRYVPVGYGVEPDASGASYGFAAAAVTGGEVFVAGLTPRSLQADIGFLDILKAMGCDVRETPDGILVTGTGDLRGVSADMGAMPDAVPTAAAVALFAKGESVIRNVAHLRYKESDRLGALVDELRKLGAEVDPLDDGLVISPSPLRGAALDCRDDHRLAMSFAVIGLRVPGVTINRPACVSKSFPGFWDALGSLARAPGGTEGEERR